MGSDHVNFPGAFVFQYKGIFTSSILSFPKTAWIEDPASSSRASLHTHPKPEECHCQAGRPSPPPPSRSAAARQKLRAHPQLGFKSLSWPGPGFLQERGKRPSPIPALLLLHKGFAHRYRVRVLAVHRAQPRVRVLVVARTALG